MKRVHISRLEKTSVKGIKRIDRSSRWGNPFKLIKHGGPYTLEESLRAYDLWLDERLEENPDFLEPLRGYDLGCPCKEGYRCHGDIILRKMHVLYGG